jgi:hypothetical protein
MDAVLASVEAGDFSAAWAVRPAAMNVARMNAMIVFFIACFFVISSW